MSKHTPGPWTCDVRYHTDVEYGRIPHVTPVNGENTVAQLGVGYVNEAMWANACLIAAAPELLAACVNAAGMIYALTGEEGDTLKMIRAAIAKAEGGQDE